MLQFCDRFNDVFTALKELLLCLEQLFLKIGLSQFEGLLGLFNISKILIFCLFDELQVLAHLRIAEVAVEVVDVVGREVETDCLSDMPHH